MKKLTVLLLVLTGLLLFTACEEFAKVKPDRTPVPSYINGGKFIQSP